MAKRKEPRSGEEKDKVKTPDEITEALPLWSRPVVLVSREKFDDSVRALRESTTIVNDEKETVAFEGEIKGTFIRLYEVAYPMIGNMMQTLFETGGFLSGVRKFLKPHKLFGAWIRLTGIPERTAYNYLRVYETFGQDLFNIGYLGTKKLLIASRIPDSLAYVKQHEQTIAKEPAEELAKKLRDLRSRKSKQAVGRKPTYVEVGGCKIRPSLDGTKIIVEGLTKKRQKEIIEGIKDLLSRAK